MTNLAIADNDTVIQYTASAAQTVFPYDFPILDQGELMVSVDQIDQVIATNYTVDGVGDDGGGNVTFVTPMTGGEIVTIWLDMPIKRLTGFNEGAATLLGTDLNTELTRQVRHDQMLRRDIRRAIRLAPDDLASSNDMELPASATLPGKYLAFDVNGLPIASEGTGTDTGLRTDLATTTAGGDGARLIGYRHTGTGSVARTLFAKLFDLLAGGDFGLAGDGATDDTATFADLLTAATDRRVDLRGGTYLLTGDQLTIGGSMEVRGEPGVTVLKCASSLSSVALIEVDVDEGDVVVFDGITFDVNQPTADSWTNIMLQVTGKGTVIVKNTCRFTNSAATAFPAANNGYGLYLTGAWGNVVVEPGVLFELHRYGVITEPTSTGDTLKLFGVDFERLAGDGVEVNVPSGSCDDVLVLGCSFKSIGSNNAGRGFGIGASGDIQRLRIDMCDFEGVDNQDIHIEDSVNEAIIGPCTHKNFGTATATSFGSAIYIAAASTAINRVIVHPQVILGAASSDYGIFSGTTPVCELLVIMDQVIDTIGNGPGIFVGSAWRQVKFGNIVVEDAADVGVICYADDVEFGAIDAQGCTFALELDGNVRHFQGGKLNLRGNDNIGIDTGATAITLPIELLGSQANEVEDVSATASGNSADTPILDLGVGAYGILTFSVRDGADYAVRMYTIDWDGTTLTPAEIAANSSGVLAISSTPTTALTMSGNNLRGKYFNGDAGTRTADLEMTFVGTILFK